MNPTLEILQGELERLFTMSELADVTRNLLGLDPDELGGTASGKAAFVRRLVDRCERDAAVEALADAVQLTKSGMVDPRLKGVFRNEVGHELEVGVRVGPFEVVEAMGPFSLGTTFLALRDGEQGEEVRLEVVRGSLAADRRSVNRYLTLLRAAGRIEGPGLASPLLVGVLEDGRPWAGYPHVQGLEPLSALVAESPMAFVEARPILRAVLDSLEALHKAGLAHGDLKVENVLVRDAAAGDIRLVGLGADRLLARPADEGTGLLPAAGTPKAMAPEQARGSSPDRRADLYAFGVLLHEVLTGRPVFPARSPVDIVARHLTEEPRPLSGLAPKGAVPAELDELVAELLRKDALRRPKDVAAVREALESCARAQERAEKPPEGSVEDVLAAVETLLESPADAEAAEAVEEAAESADCWNEAVEGFEQALERLEDQPEARKGILFRLARIHQAELGDPERAEKLYQRVLELDPGDPVAEAAVEELKRVTGKFDEVIELLVQRAERESDPAERAIALREVARIHEEETGQPQQAFAAMLAAFELVQDDQMLEDLARLAGVTGQWNDLVQACSNLLQTLQDPCAVLSITNHMGEWYGERLGRYDYALPCYQQALALDPSNDAALQGMEEVFRRQQQWPELASVLLARADASRYPADRRDRLAEAARIFDERLSDQARAVELYRMILADDPAHEASVAAFERILVRTEAWDDLVKLYRTKDEALTDPERKAETRYFVAEVYEDRLRNDAAAIAAYSQVLEVDPHHVPTLKGLERLQAKTGAFRELLATLATELEIAATPRQRASLHQRRGELLEEEFHEREEALAEWRAVLEIDPDSDEALNAIERLLKALERWEELDETYDRHIDQTEDKARRAQLLRERANLLSERLHDDERAGDVLASLVELEPGSVEVLDELARARLASGDAEGAVDALRRLAGATEDKAKVATVWVRVGELCERSLGLHEEAEAAYRKALDADKTNVSAAAALHERYASRGDMTAALDMLERQLEAATGDLERARLYTEMGRVCRDKLKEPDRAVSYFEKALAHDRSNAEAAEPLAEIHRAAGRWDAAVAIYDRFADATAAMPRDKKIEFYGAWGEACFGAGDLDKAAKAFASILAVDPADHEAAARLADVHFEAGQWAEAREQFEAALGRGGEEIEVRRRATLHMRLGLARKRLGDLSGAGRSLDDALALAGDDVEALRARADVHLDAGEHQKAADVLARLVEVTATDREKVELQIELGDLLAKELVEHRKAAEVYSAALALDPENRNLLTRLMAAHSATKEWSHLVEVVLKIADLETDQHKLARYHQTAAMILHQELGRPEEAREYYEMAVEQDPTLQKSFEALAQILTDMGEWEDLAKAYQEMLERLPADVTAESRVAMLDALADVLQGKLGRPAEAVEFLESAQALDPENRPRRETLARLYGDDPSQAHRSIPLHHQLLGQNPFRAESYQALRRIYAARNQIDEQWCCARTLVALHMADEEEDALFNRYKSDEIPAPGDRLTDEHWQTHLLHRQQDRNITSIFETILPAVLKAQAQPHKAYDLDPSMARRIETDEHPFSAMVLFAAGTLGMDPPPVFFHESRPDTAYLIRTNPPALLAGANALNAAYQNPRALAYVVGRQLAYAWRGNLMRVLLESGTMMRAWLLAALKHVVPRIPVPQDLAGTVAACDAKLSAGLGMIENEALRTQVLSFIESAAQVDLKLWASAVDYSADRVGFLLTDDLELATQLVRLDEASPGQTKDRLKELNLFSVSPDYFALRQKLYIQLQEG